MAKEIKKMNLSTYERYNTASLEVTPFQAQKLTHVIKCWIQNHFCLFDNNDKQIVRSQSRLYDILGEDKTEAIEYWGRERRNDKVFFVHIFTFCYYFFRLRKW